MPKVQRRYLPALSKLDGIFRLIRLECCENCCLEASPLTAEDRIIRDCFETMEDHYRRSIAVDLRGSWRSECPSLDAMYSFASVWEVINIWKANGVVSRKLLTDRIPLIVNDARVFIKRRHRTAVKMIPISALGPLLSSNTLTSNILSRLGDEGEPTDSDDHLFIHILDHPSVFFGPMNNAVDGRGVFASYFERCSQMQPIFRQDAQNVALQILRSVPSPLLRTMPMTQIRKFGDLFVCGFEGIRFNLTWVEFVCHSYYVSKAIY